jgi:hypothetical protein
VSGPGQLGRGQSAEQVTLTRAGISATPRWEEQFGEYLNDSLEAQFGLNCLTSAKITKPSSLLPPAVIDTIGDWARYSVVSADDGMLALGELPAPAVAAETLLREFGIPADVLPETYRGARFSNAVYFVADGAVYELLSDVAVRLRSWTAEEQARFASREVFPFLTEDRPSVGRCVAVVCLPGRIASAAGARGYRTAIHESGRLAQLLELCLDGWHWTTEFDDFAVCDLLDLDGLQRFPVRIGLDLQGATP